MHVRYFSKCWRYSRRTNKQTNKMANDLKSPISIKEIEILINNLPTQKTPDPNGFTVNCTKHLRKKLYNSLQSFSKY